MAKFAALMRSKIQPNPYPVASVAWEDYERGALYYREGRTWGGDGKKIYIPVLDNWREDYYDR